MWESEVIMLWGFGSRCFTWVVRADLHKEASQQELAGDKGWVAQMRRSIAHRGYRWPKMASRLLCWFMFWWPSAPNSSASPKEAEGSYMGIESKNTYWATAGQRDSFSWVRNFPGVLSLFYDISAWTALELLPPAPRSLGGQVSQLPLGLQDILSSFYLLFL